MEVWGSHTAPGGRVSFDAGELGVAENALGWMTENDLVQAALFVRMRELEAETRGAFTLLPPAKVERVERTAEHGTSSTAAARPRAAVSDAPLRVTLSDGRVARVRLLLGADGPESAVKRFLGVQTVGRAYGQHGVVATVRTAAPHSTAWQRFLRPTGAPRSATPTFCAAKPTPRSSLPTSTPRFARRLRNSRPEDGSRPSRSRSRPRSQSCSRCFCRTRTRATVALLWRTRPCRRS
jgi:2-polyprenyl-6-methoxyphenol hydroxylase-like FAD-dependent oxidoreductase